MSAAAGSGPAPAAALRHRRLRVPVLVALAGLTWLTLWAWARSPYGRWLDHGDWTASGPAAALCRAIPAGDIVVPALLYALAWMLVMTAMMLPTTLPLFNAFDRLTQQRPDRIRLLTLLCPGYLAAWGAFGLLAHGLHGALLACVARVPALARLAHWHRGLRAGRCFSIQQAQAPMPGEMPHPAQLCHRALARPGAGAAGLLAGRAARPVLRRLLPGPDAADVCRGRRQPGLDAGAGRHPCLCFSRWTRPAGSAGRRCRSGWPESRAAPPALAG